MTRARYAAAMLLVLSAGGAAAQEGGKGAAGDLPPPGTVLERNVVLEWEGEEDDGRVFVHDGLRATLSVQHEDGFEDWAESATLTIVHPELGTHAVTATAGLSGFGDLGVFDLDLAGGTTVLFGSFTGGAHCCIEVHAVWFGEDGPVAVEVGTFDGDRVRPDDIDGDGVYEIAVNDDRFNYTFDSYAASFPPPRVLVFEAGEMRDASAEPRFRAVIEEEFEYAARFCGGDEGWYAGACAGLAANAARLGTYGQTMAAIAARLFTGEPLDSGWDDYSFCLDEDCDETFDTSDLLEAIEYALGEWGYLEG